MNKRIICILLTLAMVLTLVPSVAFAENAAGFDNFKKVQTYTDEQFTDVMATDWFAENVADAYELNLMLGRSDDFFDTESNLTVAEAMTIAARLREIYYTGKAEFTQDKGYLWYQVYTNYCKANGIADPADYDLGKAITRGEFAEIFAKALPSDALKKINEVQDNMIPDVKKTDKFSEAIYLLYRAGIIVGNDEKGTFAPDSNIRRMEVVAITTRMAQPTLRQSITLVEQSSDGIDAEAAIIGGLLAASTLAALALKAAMSASVSVTRVTLDKTDITLTVGDEDVKLTATVAPENATNKAVTWSSSDTDVVTVDNKGNVHAVSTGTAIITVTTVDGKKTAICKVTATACLAAGTMITMEDGSRQAVETLELGDMIKTFDHETGEVSSAPVCFIWESKNVGNAFTLAFEDDIEVTVIEEHGFYDQEEQKYVFINLQNAKEYIGDHFYNADTNSWLELLGCEKLDGTVDAYAIITSGHLNHMSNGMLSMCDGTVKKIANIFEYDDQMKFDENKKKADIEAYGLTSKEKIMEFEGFLESDYDDYNLQYLNVAIGKGLTTWEWIKAFSDYCVANGL